MTAGTRSRSPYVELAVPSLLLAAFGLTAWLSTFAGSSGDAVTAPYLRARADGQISGVAAAARAIEEARTAVPNTSEADDGLLA